MNILFLTLLEFSTLSQRNIYTDLQPDPTQTQERDVSHRGRQLSHSSFKDRQYAENQDD